MLRFYLELRKTAEASKSCLEGENRMAKPSRSSPLSRRCIRKVFIGVDITEEQAHVLSETDKALVVLRLKSRNILMVKWEVLKSYLTQECKRYNANEYNHWKLNIYTDHIKISGNNREIPAKVWHFNAEV